MAEFLLIKAAARGNLEEARRLLIDGINVNEEDENGETALIHSAMTGHFEIVSLLIEFGAKINHQNHNGFTALHWAAANNHPSIVSLLIEKGADINIQNMFGYTPLVRSAYKGNAAIVSLLLQSGADYALSNKHGRNALSMAKQFRHPDCVALLEGYEHFHRYRVTWLSFSTSLRSSQDHQNQEFKHSQIQSQIQVQSPSLMRVMDSSDLVRYVTEFM